MECPAVQCGWAREYSAGPMAQVTAKGGSLGKETEDPHQALFDCFYCPWEEGQCPGAIFKAFLQQRSATSPNGARLGHVREQGLIKSLHAQLVRGKKMDPHLPCRGFQWSQETRQAPQSCLREQVDRPSHAQTMSGFLVPRTVGRWGWQTLGTVGVSSTVAVRSPSSSAVDANPTPPSGTLPQGSCRAFQTCSFPSSPRSPTHRIPEKEAGWAGSHLPPFHRWGN